VIVYISIGNSDDKLTQREWSNFITDLDAHLEYYADDRSAQIHGRWFSAPDDPWQNACWCVELVVDDATDVAAGLKARLRVLAAKYRQDAISWAVAETEFLSPAVGGAE